MNAGVTTLADWGAAAGFAYTVDGTANTIEKYADDLQQLGLLNRNGGAIGHDNA